MQPSKPVPSSNASEKKHIRVYSTILTRSMIISKRQVGIDNWDLYHSPLCPKVQQSPVSAVTNGPKREDTCIRCLRATNAQTSLRIHAVCLISAFAIRILENMISKLATGVISFFS